MKRTNEFGNSANIVHLNNVRVAPRKMRVVIDLVRHMNVHEALVTLAYNDRGAAKDVAKLIESGIANVQNVIPEWDVDELFIKTAYVNEGPTMRRFRPRAQGRATRINKRTSKVTIELRPEFEDEA
jgi:large subunit ribosomal protein L22